MQTANASGLWRGRNDFNNSVTQRHLPNPSSSANQAYTLYQGVYNGSLQNHGDNYYLPQPRPANILPSSVQYAETLPDHREFGAFARVPMRPPSSMPHDNFVTFNNTSEAHVIALAGNNDTAEPSHVMQIQWERNKTEIKRIYLDEDRSLADTMQHMESLGFVASLKLYKEKLKEWKFLKNLPGETAYWLVNHDQQRKSAGKDTRYTFGERELPIEQAQKSAARYMQRYKLPLAAFASAVAPQTPAEISYATPSTYAASPCYASSAIPATPSHLDNGKDVEEELWYPRFTFAGNPKSHYDELVTEAEQFSSSGQHIEALEKYLDALAGYRNLLSPTHDLIISTVYKVAHLHMKLHDTKAADQILESATEAHVREHGLWDSKTVQHISQLVKMLQGWARQNEALPLVLHLLQGQESESYSTLPSSTTSVNLDAAGIQRQLTVANMLAPVMDETTKARLVALAQLCEAQPLEFPKQTLDVWVALVRNYNDTGDDDHLEDALNRAANSVRTFSDLEESAWTIPMYLSLLSLMQLFVTCGLHGFVDDVLLAMEERVDYTLDKSPEDMIDILLRTGLLYQQEDMWPDADHYFQHAQAASARSFGRMDARTKAIEDARRQQYYNPKLLSVHRVCL